MAAARTAKFSYRAEPTPAQERWLAGAFGATRVAYNDYLWQRERVFRGEQEEVVPLSRFGCLPADKAWMREHPQRAIQQAVRQAETAYRNFFRSVKGGPRRGKPRFKKRRAGGSLTLAGGLKIEKLSNRWAALRLPKGGGWLKFRLSRELPSQPTGVTLKLSPAGEYRLSFTVQQAVKPAKAAGPAAGVDPGLLDLVTVATDEGARYKVAAPRGYRRAERKLARLNRAIARKTSGSQNRERARLALAKQHAKVARQRLDLQRKIAFKLADENQAVAFEDLSVAGLARTRFAKSFADAGIGGLKGAVESACEREGTAFALVPPAYTTQTCAVCGLGGGRKSLATRQWQCACGALLDRDYNAAVNVLLAGGHSESLNGPGGRVRRGELARPAPSAMPDEGATGFAAHRPRRRRTRAVSLARRARLEAHASA